MEQYLSPLIAWIESLATQVSLEVFVVVGAFLEEIIAPIPSPFVMTTAAVLAQVQGYTTWHLLVLITLASFAKMLSSYVVYVVADKAEDVIIGKFGKYFGVSHAHIESLGNMLTKSWWDDVLLLIARSLPIVPTFPVSVGAGVIKYSVRSYLLMTFIGTFIRNVIYLLIAFYGWTHLQTWKDELWQHPLWLAIAVIIALLFVIFILKAKDSLWDRLLRKTTIKK